VRNTINVVSIAVLVYFVAMQLHMLALAILSAWAL